MAEVLAIVVSYKNPALGIKAAKSLVKQSVPVDVVVWDNFSTDANRAAINAAVDGSAKRLFPQSVTVVVDPENKLWTPAINTAADWFLKDHHRFLLIMNNDCELTSKTVASLLEVFEEHPSAALVGPLVTAIGGPQEPLNCRGRKEPFRAPYLMGACTMVRRSVWDEVGTLDPNLPLGADDHDYAIRVTHAGHTIWVDPRVQANHRGHASGGGPEWDLYGHPSWAFFNRKWDWYYANEEEGLKAHWGGEFDPDFVRGTGWSEEKYQRRIMEGDFDA